MSNPRLLDYFNECRANLLTNCIECGRCVDDCRAMKAIPDPPRAGEVISGIKEFLRGGTLSEAASLKTTVCTGCYGCIDLNCPIGLDSLCINQLVLRAAELKKEKPFSMPLYEQHHQQLNELVTPDERSRITTPVYTPGAKYVFFPGCNVYLQPDKILNALDILDAVGLPYSFIPGIQYCCGLPRGFIGDADWLQDSAERLIEKVVEYGAQTVIFWCPTCLCNMKYRVSKFIEELPFETISFGKYVSQNMNRLTFPAAEQHTVTLHEPCKTAYMNIDLDDVRNLLHAIPGTTVVEMEHHHKDTACCGCLAVNRMPNVGKAMTDKRFDEAVATGADKMLDVCHTCHLIFCQRLKENGRTDVDVENYSTYIVNALGNPRKDRLK